MLSKPFRPPLLRKPIGDAGPGESAQDVGRPSKRRRVGEVEHVELRKNPASTGLQPISDRLNPSKIQPHRLPLASVQNPPNPEQQKSEYLNGSEGYYRVLWRKFTAKKHKTWDGDGLLVVREGYALLQDVSGRDLGRSAYSNPLLPGSTLSVGGKDIEVDSVISKVEFFAGKSSTKPSKPLATSVIAETKPCEQPSKPLIQVSATKEKPKVSLQAQIKNEMLRAKEKPKEEPKVVRSKGTGMKAAFKNPVIDPTVMRQVPGEMPVPRHDPQAPGALVMKRPRIVPNGTQVMDVVVDPLVAKHLREHQRKGVAFLYECVMGLRDFGGEGCILADEMGLGKTLQAIALLWTLLKQNPVHGEGPVIKKALIVCPVTLIHNWQKEFRRWLGGERIGVFVADGKRTRLTDFTMGKSYSIMIIGYERLRTVAEDLAKGGGIDIVIADEGHRLKTVQNKSAQAIQSLNTARRVILSGTPIQNDLSEFFSMVNFVNDGLLGTYKQFMKNFENPIVKSRQPDAPEKETELGKSRSEELAQATSKFILRRTADILSKYLPPKTEYVLFCEPTPTQANIYRHVLASPMFQFALGSSESALQLITILKKLCNSPSLLNPKIATSDETANSASIISLLETLPQSLLRTMGPQASTKIRLLDNLLYTLHKRTSEKIVLVSNYTSTLDLLQNLLTSLSLPFLRLDGSTPSSKRQSLVDDFNRSPSSSVFAFLLSAKAGGMGLNLIGASRLVLFDVDWNPAVEEQAMARIHREGQKKPCRIYRFVMKGGLEERVWQRQVVKKGLASSIMDGDNASGTGAGVSGGAGLGKKGVAQFSREELRDLFRLDERPGLRTHDLIGCACQGRGCVGRLQQPREEDVEPTDGVDTPLSMGTLNDNKDDEALDEDDTDSLPDLPAIVRASTKDRNRTELAQHQRQKTHVSGESSKEQLQGLMEYVHIDTSSFANDNGLASKDPANMLIDDEILTHVLRNDGDGEQSPHVVGGVAWVFKKTSGGGGGGGGGSDDAVTGGEMVEGV